MDEQPHLYQQIAETIRRRIVAGVLDVGDRLPSVRDMAGRWNCTPATVNRAYQVLAGEGLVSSHAGRGTVVAPGALQAGGERGSWEALVHRAERYLLAAAEGGYTPPQAAAALGVATGRWQELQQQTAQGAHLANQIRFAGSHDLALTILATLSGNLLPGLHWQTNFVGSLGGLMALARGEAELAGCHLWDPDDDLYNVPFVRHLFPGRRVGLLTLAQRDLGLIVAAGNPHGLREVGDLCRSGVRVVNRQAGSGTRVWLDAQLALAGVEAKQIAGYEREAATHMALARAVADGEADVGLGIYAAAQAYALDFVPLAQEQYDLVMPASAWDTANGAVIREVVRSEEFAEALDALGGYDHTSSGEEIWL